MRWNNSSTAVAPMILASAIGLLIGCAPKSPANSPEAVPAAQPAPVAAVQAPTSQPSDTPGGPAAQQDGSAAQQDGSAESSPVSATQSPAPDQEGDLLIDAMSPGAWGSQAGTMAEAKEGGTTMLRYVTENPGENKWSLQICLGGVVLVKGRAYEVSLEARSGDPQMDSYPVVVIADGISQSGKHEHAGLFRKITLGSQWQTYDLRFVSSRGHETPSRLCINPENIPGIIDIRKVTLKPVK